MPKIAPNDQLHKSNVLHALEQLEKDGLIHKYRGRWYCTEKGEEVQKLLPPDVADI